MPNPNKSRKQTQFNCAIILIIFGISSLLAGFFFNFNKGDFIYEILNPEGGIIGPLTTTKDREVISIEVEQAMANKQWSTIYASLLDEKKEPLLAFEKGLYAESGYDSEGHWSENVSKFSSRLTIPKKGTFYLEIETDRAQGVASDLKVTVTHKMGSSLAFFIAGIGSLIIGAILFYKT